MDDLLRNGSGYVDPTAYEAIKKMEDRKMMERGEIWWVNFGEQERLVAVVTVHTGVCSMVVLNMEQRNSADIELIDNGGTSFWVVVERFSYKQMNDFTRKAGDLCTDSLRYLLQTLARRLDLGTPSREAEPQTVSLETNLLIGYKDAQEYIEHLEEELLKSNTARDLYKVEYRDLMAQVIGR